MLHCGKWSAENGRGWASRRFFFQPGGPWSWLAVASGSPFRSVEPRRPSSVRREAILVGYGTLCGAASGNGPRRTPAAPWFTSVSERGPDRPSGLSWELGGIWDHMQQRFPRPGGGNPNLKQPQCLTLSLFSFSHFIHLESL